MDSPANARAGVPARWFLLLLVGGFTLLQAWRGSAAAEPVHCDVDRPRTEVRAVMLATSWCGHCGRARAFFDRHAIAWCEYDIERTGEGKRLYDEVGVAGIPVILVGERRVLGFDEARLRQVLGL